MARLDEEIEEIQAKAEEDKLKAEAAKKSGSEASGKPTIDEEVAAPTDNVKQQPLKRRRRQRLRATMRGKKKRGRVAQRRNRGRAAEAASRPKSKKKGDFKAQEKGVASVAAAKKSAEDTHIQMLAHEKSLEAAEQVEAGCPDENNDTKGKSGSATGSET